MGKISEAYAQHGPAVLAAARELVAAGVVRGLAGAIAEKTQIRKRTVEYVRDRAHDTGEWPLPKGFQRHDSQTHAKAKHPPFAPQALDPPWRARRKRLVPDPWELEHIFAEIDDEQDLGKP